MRYRVYSAGLPSAVGQHNGLRQIPYLPMLMCPALKQNEASYRMCSAGLPCGADQHDGMRQALQPGQSPQACSATLCDQHWAKFQLSNTDELGQVKRLGMAGRSVIRFSILSLLNACPPVCLSGSTLSLSACLSVSRSVRPSVSVCLPVCLPACLPVLPACLPACLSVCLLVCVHAADLVAATYVCWRMPRPS